MYAVVISLRAPDFMAATWVDSVAVETAIKQSQVSAREFEHLSVRAESDHLDIWLFLLAPSGMEAAECAYLLCRRALRDQQALLGWTGDVQAFVVAPQAD